MGLGLSKEVKRFADGADRGSGSQQQTYKDEKERNSTRPSEEPREQFKTSSGQLGRERRRKKKRIKKSRLLEEIQGHQVSKTTRPPVIRKWSA